MGKKIIAAVIIFAAAAAAAYLILLRPSDYTEESMISLFEEKKSSFITEAAYLTDYDINTTIEGFLSIDNKYGVPNMNANRFSAFNDANSHIMRDRVASIVSDGGRVEFILLDEGGLLNRINAKIVYAPEAEASSAAKQLSEKDWYLYMTK